MGLTCANLGPLQTKLVLRWVNMGIKSKHLANLGLICANLGLILTELQLLHTCLGLILAKIGFIWVNFELIWANLELIGITWGFYGKNYFRL